MYVSPGKLIRGGEGLIGEGTYSQPREDEAPLLFQIIYFRRHSQNIFQTLLSHQLLNQNRKSIGFVSPFYKWNVQFIP